MNSKKRILKRGLTLTMAVAMVLLYSLMPVFMQTAKSESISYAYTNGDVKIETIGSPGGMQGDENITVGFEITNDRDEEVTVANMQLSIPGSGITVKQNSGTISIPTGGKQNVSFSVVISKRATVGESQCNFKANLKDSAGSVLKNQPTLEENTTFMVYERMSTDGVDSKTVAAVDISHEIVPANGFVSGNDNKLKIEFYNYGNTTIKNARVALTLPEGLSIYNGSNQADLGYVSVGTRKTVEFPITVKDGIEGKNYAVEVEILGLNFMNGDVVAKKTFYIPVEGSGGNVGTDNIAITNVSMPEEMVAGQPFDLKFNVQNSGTKPVKNVKINVEPPEGIINKSKNIFIDNFGKGESKQYSVRLFSFEGSAEKSYPVKITATSTNATDKDAVGITQYATVTIASDGKTAKKPQLMVDNYTYGGSAVQAGTDFYLNLGIFNTSGKTLSNVKVSLSNADGVFVPVGGSNSFFIESVPAKGHYTKSIRFTTKPQAEQKTTPITVALTYEDSAGNPLEATDTISIPVTQKTKLATADLVPPTEIYVGQQGTCELEFYNMGKTTLSNLRIACQGDFDIMESNDYYAGNMDSGKSDNYRFNFVPKQAGPMTGTITFSFEDANGDPQFLEVPFTFEAMEMPIMDEVNPDDMQTKKPIPWTVIIAGVVVALGIIGGVIFKKHRKKKLHDALEIEDDYDYNMDIGKAEEEVNADNKTADNAANKNADKTDDTKKPHVK